MLLRFCWLFLLAHVCAVGQDGWDIAFPAQDQTDVSPSASIYIRSTTVLDTAQWNMLGPPVIVLRDSIARLHPRIHWQRFRVSGNAEVIDETTLRWTPKHLLPSTTYRCVTKNMELTFTTASDVPRIRYCNLGPTPLLCNTPIEVQLTSPFQSSLNLTASCMWSNFFLQEYGSARR